MRMLAIRQHAHQPVLTHMRICAIMQSVRHAKLTIEKDTIMQDTITITHGVTGSQVTIPAGKNHAARRETGDVLLVGQVQVGIPISVVIRLSPTGDWEHWTTLYGVENHYLHFRDGTPDHAPTPDQRDTLARWFLRLDRAYNLPLGEPVCVWAFGDATPQDLARVWGSSSTTCMRVYGSKTFTR